MPLMAVLTTQEIDMDELELIEALRTAVKAFEARKMTKVVEKVSFGYLETGPITYDIKIRDITSPTQPPITS